MVENYFKAIQVHKKDKLSESYPQQSAFNIVPRYLSNNLINNLSKNPNVFKSGSKLTFKSAAVLVSKMIVLNKMILTRKNRMVIKESEEYKSKMLEFKKKSMQIVPLVEGRIKIIENKNVD